MAETHVSESEIESEEEIQPQTSFEELIKLIQSEYNNIICLTQYQFWREFPRLLEEMIPVPVALEDQVEKFKILLKRMENYFLSHTEISSDQSLKHVLPQVKKVMGTGFKTLFSVELQEELEKWLETLLPTLRDMEGLSVSSLPTIATSTSTTTVLTQENPAGASGEKKSRKRKALNSEEGFNDLADEEELENSLYPTGNVSSYISVRRDDKVSHRILTDKYSTYLMKLQIWKSQDLKGPEGRAVWHYQDKKNVVWKEIAMSYPDFSPMAKAMIATEEASIQTLLAAKKSGKKIKTSFPSYGRYSSNTQ